MHHGYILRAQITGLFKVGVTGNPKSRMAQYRTHVPEKVVTEVVKTFVSKEEALEWERIILDNYKDAIEHGEWLSISFEQAAEICMMGRPASYYLVERNERVMIAAEQSIAGRDPVTRILHYKTDDQADRLEHILQDWLLPFRHEELPRFLTDEFFERYQAWRAAPKPRGKLAAWLDKNHPLGAK